jgi:hypothetical protein
VLAVAAGLVALYVSTRRTPEVVPPVTSFAAGAESLNAATRRRDWAEAERWGERLAAEQPRNFQVIYELALSLHNHSTAMTPRFNRPRAALRTSLDRIAAEMRVLALLDSATRLAATPDDWARAQLLRGMAFEGLGFPIEALDIFRAVNQRSPKLGGPVLRMRWISAHLANPRVPDSLDVREPEPARPPAPAPAPPPAAPSYSDSTARPDSTQPR